ncbi:hypothetical protein COT47_04085, partial [Candidatus Woesearchaeota archaeon CG08_land_8_20_14_0_20_43_7]
MANEIDLAYRNELIDNGLFGSKRLDTLRDIRNKLDSTDILIDEVHLTAQENSRLRNGGGERAADPELVAAAKLIDQAFKEAGFFGEKGVTESLLKGTTDLIRTKIEGKDIDLPAPLMTDKGMDLLTAKMREIAKRDGIESLLDRPELLRASANAQLETYSQTEGVQWGQHIENGVSRIVPISQGRNNPKMNFGNEITAIAKEVAGTRKVLGNDAAPNYDSIKISENAQSVDQYTNIKRLLRAGGQITGMSGSNFNAKVMDVIFGMRTEISVDPVAKYFKDSLSRIEGKSDVKDVLDTLGIDAASAKERTFDFNQITSDKFTNIKDISRLSEEIARSDSNYYVDATTKTGGKLLREQFLKDMEAKSDVNMILSSRNGEGTEWLLRVKAKDGSSAREFELTETEAKKWIEGESVTIKEKGVDVKLPELTKSSDGSINIKENNVAVWATKPNKFGLDFKVTGGKIRVLTDSGTNINDLVQALGRADRGAFINEKSVLHIGEEAKTPDALLEMSLTNMKKDFQESLLKETAAAIRAVRSDLLSQALEKASYGNKGVDAELRQKILDEISRSQKESGMDAYLREAKAQDSLDYLKDIARKEQEAINRIAKDLEGTSPGDVFKNAVKDPATLEFKFASEVDATAKGLVEGKDITDVIDLFGKRVTKDMLPKETAGQINNEVVESSSGTTESGSKNGKDKAVDRLNSELRDTLKEEMTPDKIDSMLEIARNAAATVPDAQKSATVVRSIADTLQSETTRQIPLDQLEQMAKTVVRDLFAIEKADSTLADDLASATPQETIIMARDKIDELNRQIEDTDPSPGAEALLSEERDKTKVLLNNELMKLELSAAGMSIESIGKLDNYFSSTNDLKEMLRPYTAPEQRTMLHSFHVSDDDANKILKYFGFESDSVKTTVVAAPIIVTLQADKDLRDLVAQAEKDSLVVTVSNKQAYADLVSNVQIGNMQGFMATIPTTVKTEKENLEDAVRSLLLQSVSGKTALDAAYERQKILDKANTNLEAILKHEGVTETDAAKLLKATIAQDIVETNIQMQEALGPEIEKLAFSDYHYEHNKMEYHNDLISISMGLPPKRQLEQGLVVQPSALLYHKAGKTYKAIFNYGDEQIQVATIDIQDFKNQVNGRYGHDVGDTYLKTVASKLEEKISAWDSTKDDPVKFLSDMLTDNTFKRSIITDVETKMGSDVHITVDKDFAGMKVDNVNGKDTVEIQKGKDQDLIIIVNGNKNFVSVSAADQTQTFDGIEMDLKTDTEGNVVVEFARGLLTDELNFYAGVSKKGDITDIDGKGIEKAQALNDQSATAGKYGQLYQIGGLDPYDIDGNHITYTEQDIALAKATKGTSVVSYKVNEPIILSLLDDLHDLSDEVLNEFGFFGEKIEYAPISSYMTDRSIALKSIKSGISTFEDLYNYNDQIYSVFVQNNEFGNHLDGNNYFKLATNKLLDSSGKIDFRRVFIVGGDELGFVISGNDEVRFARIDINNFGKTNQKYTSEVADKLKTKMLDIVQGVLDSKDVHKLSNDDIAKRMNRAVIDYVTKNIDSSIDDNLMPLLSIGIVTVDKDHSKVDAGRLNKISDIASEAAKADIKAKILSGGFTALEAVNAGFSVKTAT